MRSGFLNERLQQFKVDALIRWKIFRTRRPAKNDRIEGTQLQAKRASPRASNRSTGTTNWRWSLHQSPKPTAKPTELSLSSTLVSQAAKRELPLRFNQVKPASRWAPLRQSVRAAS